MTDLKIKLGKRIKNIRKIRNITQEQLAEMINMDITTLSKIETGRNYPMPETVEKLANALEVDIESLFSFKEKLSKKDYIEAINKNISLIANNDEKLRLLYEISSLLSC